MTEVRPGYISDGNNNWIQIGPSIPLGSTVYYQASEPSTPQTGDIWIDSDNNVPSIDNSQFLRWRKTVSGGETSLSGNDDNGLSLQYTPAYEQVYLNGVLLVRGQDYAATTGTSITGLTALAASDVVEVFSVVARVVGDAYTQSQSDNKYSLKTVTGLDLVTSTSFSSVSSVTIDNCFTSNYRNYKIMMEFDGTASSDLFYRLRTPGSSPTTDSSSNYSYLSFYWVGDSNTTGVSTANINQSLANITAVGNYYNDVSLSMDIFNPYESKETSTLNHIRGINYSNPSYKIPVFWISTTGIQSSTSFGGIIISLTSGTMTGTIKIYGYK